MLTDLPEEEFDIKEEEPWYDHQDLEQDLHLAAELGKNLLEQNRELEETLQQMQETNQEQLQEIEHLSKQVDLLRSVNDQHARVYEQLDVSARELELKNQRLVLENRAAQVTVHRLTETVDGLQTQVEELQLLVSAGQTRSSAHLEPAQHDRVQGLTHCQHKQQLHKCFSHEQCVREDQDERRALTHSLRAQLSSERAQRAAVERDAGALAHQLRELEPRAALLGVYEGRLEEVEAEVQELRLLLRSRENNTSITADDEVGVVSHRRQSHGEEHHGISLLNEMDAQYSTLKEKYDTLLRQHKSAQTHTHSHTQPAYKALFHQIFTFIQKSKEDLKENRTKPVQTE